MTGGDSLTCRLGGNRGSYGSRVHRERSSAAGRASKSVANHDYELRAIVGTGRRGRGIAGKGRTADGHAVLLPLIAKRVAARRNYGEGGGLPYGHCLVCGLRRDRRVAIADGVGCDEPGTSKIRKCE